MKRKQVAVIGSAGPEEYPGQKPTKKTFEIAYEVGKLLAEENVIVICGGKGGIMEAVCKGAKENNGITVGVVSGNIRGTSNKYVDVEIVSGFTNFGEEGLIISMADAVIVLGGGAGTLQEIALAYRSKKQIVAIAGLRGWGDKLRNSFIDERKSIKIGEAKSAKEAVELVTKP